MHRNLLEKNTFIIRTTVRDETRTRAAQFITTLRACQLQNALNGETKIVFKFF